MSFQSYGQNETLISSIRNIIKDYPVESVFKEFLQNADDAGASRYHVIIDTRSHPTDSLFYNEMNAWQGPAILIFNNAKFRETDFESLMQIRVGGKQEDDTKIGKHGLGFNSCYHFTDVPSFISGDSFAFLDPQEKYLFQRGVKGSIPQNGIGEFSKKDQLLPFEGIEGIDFRSTFEGTLFRIPLRKEPSEISDDIFTTGRVLELFTSIKLMISSQFLFLRNIETIETSIIKEATIPLQITSLWKATITGLDEDIRDRRKYINNGVIKSFQIKIELTDNSGYKQEEHWIITNGAQQNPEDPQLKKYAGKYRLRVLGGIAAILKCSRNTQDNFKGRMYSFFSLPDATYLPVHLNGTWAQGSDRGKLLIEKDDLPDIDHRKLGWNRHILLDFLPKLYCKLLEEIIRLYKNNQIDLKDHPIIKYWPFPSGSHPKYIIDYGFKVLQLILQNDDIFRLINESLPDMNDRVDVLFKFIPRDAALGFQYLIRNNWGGIDMKSNPELKSLIRSLPIWPILKDPTQPDPNPALKSASCGYILPKNFRNYRTKRDSKIYLDASDDYARSSLQHLGVKQRDIYEYTFEDVEFPSEYDYHYVYFLNSVLGDSRIVNGLKDKPCFPTYTNKLEKIDQLYDLNNNIFKFIFSEKMEMFLHNDLLKFSGQLSSIGFKNQINQETFINCAKHVEMLEKENPPSDIRYRGFSLIDYLYKNINTLKFDEEMKRLHFIPISKDPGKPYSMSYVRKQTLDCFDDIILSKYKEVAWSQKSLIAEDVVPPSHVLQKYPLLAKPEVTVVVEHLRFLYENIRIHDEWKRNWAAVFKNNVFEVYKWLEYECKTNKADLSDEIKSGDRLFLNIHNKDADPFDDKNWVSANDLILNSEKDEDKYVSVSLQKYPTMLKSAGAKEVKRPSTKIHVRVHNQSSTTSNAMFKFLFDREFSLNDVTFVVREEEIKASRYMLAASSEFFRQKFSSIDPGPIRITIEGVEPNAMQILLQYLYGQDIDVTIKNLNIDDNDDTARYALYKNLLKLANDYELVHLKELMELRLTRWITRSNVESIKQFAEISGANQLKEFCDHFIIVNSDL
ncbi:hypothetical protein RclHR1_00900024 [Rhizophagus clarus]|uniref:Sacsin-like n=1 Tax=Rhizophagus clarus TaxID=94130 RepID=A0A2Z6S2M2_9GLOM|nr:hypothetical protein RclHR1_00900024 [Rhizophagus clarus]GES73262.1 sacsin-like [Rhizophagus clarus]